LLSTCTTSVTVSSRRPPDRTRAMPTCAPGRRPSSVARAFGGEGREQGNICTKVADARASPPSRAEQTVRQHHQLGIAVLNRKRSKVLGHALHGQCVPHERLRLRRVAAPRPRRRP
jgi:hypothetical protein